MPGKFQCFFSKAGIDLRPFIARSREIIGLIGRYYPVMLKINFSPTDGSGGSKYGGANDAIQLFLNDGLSLLAQGNNAMQMGSPDIVPFGAAKNRFLSALRGCSELQIPEKRISLQGIIDSLNGIKGILTSRDKTGSSALQDEIAKYEKQLAGLQATEATKVKPVNPKLFKQKAPDLILNLSDFTEITEPVEKADLAMLIKIINEKKTYKKAETAELRSMLTQARLNMIDPRYYENFLPIDLSSYVWDAEAERNLETSGQMIKDIPMNKLNIPAYPFYAANSRSAPTIFHMYYLFGMRLFKSIVSYNERKVLSFKEIKLPGSIKV